MTGSKLIAAIDERALVVPHKDVFVNHHGEHLTFGQLKSRSDALAHKIASIDAHAKTPVVLYGHKSPFMLVSIVACAKAGVPYVPIDTVYPASRVADIAQQVETRVVIDTTTQELAWSEIAPGAEVFDLDCLEQICAQEADDSPLRGLDLNDTFYILFTSGSTGKPKGVEITRECVDGFSAWMCKDYTFSDSGERVWFNRTPYCFDVSITDLVCGTLFGDTTFALEADADESLSKAFDALSQANITDWVSTPSYVDQCLADPSFNEELLPHLRRMLVAGETLRPETVRRVKERFSHIAVYNGYGPTESTDLVTLCEITDDMLSADRALPIGYPKPDSRLLVLNPETLEEVPMGESGELFIVGNTVAKGYWRRPDLTMAAFGACPPELTQGQRSYRTGDEVTLDESGLIYFHGRLDLQVKLHGFRIELGDVESKIAASPDVLAVCVLPVMRDGAVARLVACVVPADVNAPRGLKLTRKIKATVRETLPSYMIPSSFKYFDEFPLNSNGKVDRKVLASQIEV